MRWAQFYISLVSIYFASLEPMNTSCQIQILRNPISARLIAHSFFRVWLNLGCSTKHFSMNMFPQSRMTRSGKQRSDELHFAEVCQEGSSSVRLCTTGLPLPTKRCRWWWSLMIFELLIFWFLILVKKNILGSTKTRKLDWSYVQLGCISNVTPTRTSILWVTHQMSCKKEIWFNCALWVD